MAFQAYDSDLYNGYFNSNISFEVGKEDDGTSVDGAVRFTGVTIGQGTQIQNANLGVYVGVKGTGSGDLVAVIRGIDEDNTGSFSGSPFGRPETTAQDSSNWSLPPQGEYSNHNVTSIVQEIINRAGWSSGNAIGFYVFNNGSPTAVWVYTSTLQLTITLSSSSASPSPSPSRSVSKSPSPTPSSSISPSPSPSPATPEVDYGMKISKEGYDVKRSTIFEDVFSSSKGILGKRSTTTQLITTDANGVASASKATGLAYIPLCFVTVTTRGGTVVNVPGSYESDWSATEILTETFDYYIKNGSIVVEAEAYHWEPVQEGSSTQLASQAYTFNIFYCFNELSIEQ